MIYQCFITFRQKGLNVSEVISMKLQNFCLSVYAMKLSTSHPFLKLKLYKPASPHLLHGAQVQRVSAEQYQLSCGSTGTSSGNFQGREICMIWACHTPRQPRQNHPSGYLGGWVTPWSAEEMLDGQHQRVDSPAYARPAHKGLLQKRLEEDLC